MLLLVRRIGALLLIGAALYVWFAKAPDAPAHHHRDAVAAIEHQDDANNRLTQGAPQQAVVNGWTTNRYLRLISAQLDANGSRQAARDIRPAALLVLGVFGIALLALTTPGPLVPSLGGRRPTDSAAAPAGPPLGPLGPQSQVRSPGPAHPAMPSHPPATSPPGGGAGEHR